MADKKVNQLEALTDEQVDDDSRLWGVGLSSTGKLSKATTQQLKKTFHTKKRLFVAVGDEGTTITLSELAGRDVLIIAREGQVLYEVEEDPGNEEYIWDLTDITLGLETSAGERFLIIYKNV